MKRFLFAIPLLVVGGLILLLARGLSLDPREVDSPLIGKPAPAFALPILKSDGIMNEQTLAGEVSLFNVWASWCVSCRAEHDVLMALARDSDVRIFGLNYKDAPADAEQWLRERGDPYAASGMDRDGAVGIDWGVYGVPETFIIDRQGVVRAKHIGPLTWEYVNQELLPLLEQLKRS